MKNPLVVYPLLVLVSMAGFYQLFLYSEIDFTYSDSLSGMTPNATQTLNETETQYTQTAQDAVFDIDMVTGIIALIIGLVAVGVVAGVRVLGSGLSEFSVKLIYKSATYYGLWGVFSVLAFTVFSSIPFFGLFLWLGLTLVYSMGFFQTMEN